MDSPGSASDRQTDNFQTISLLQKSIEQRTIAVPDLPINLNEERLESYFGQWGAIEHTVCDRENQDFAIILFKNVDSVKEVLSSRHTLHGNSLSIEPVDYDIQPNKDNYFRAQNLLKDVKRNQLLEVLRKCTSIQDQLEVLQRELRLLPSSLYYRKALRDCFNQLFLRYFPESDLQLFGSSISGYGLEGADVDLFLKLPEDYFSRGCRNVSFTPNLEEVEMGNVNMRLLTTEARLQLLMSVLKQYMPNCKEIIFQPSKICPLVKFQYIDEESSMPCDLSAFIQTAVPSCKLMHLFHEIDQRVTPLMIFLRYWSDCQNLIKTRKKLKTFTFALLVIHFLQTRNPPILPTVDDLKELADSAVVIGKWDVSFCDDLHRIPKSTNNQTVEELLKEFFTFYANFDFANQVISVRRGKSFSKEEFMSDPANVGFRPRDISIQHFFELKRNTTFSCNRSFGKELSCKFSVAAQMFQEFGARSCRIDANWGLEQLLEEIVFFDEREKKLVSCSLSCNRQIAWIANENKELTSMWLEKVCSILRKVITIALYSECEVEYDCFKPKTSQVKESLEGKEELSVEDTEYFEADNIRIGEPVTSEDNILLLLKCKVWDNIWVRAKCRGSMFSSEEMSLGLERELSQCVIRAHASRTYVKFECSVEKLSTEFPSVTIKLKPFTRANFQKTVSVLPLIFRLVHKCMKNFPDAKFSH